ncbi:MAG TPA: 50S ribosomal protein L30 [Terriglobales bacterium]|nr:50S ribosomal protein L30 [Terriglobales bacterium]
MTDTAAKTGKARRPAPSAEPERYLKITLVRSLVGYPRSQREVARGLGLRKPQSCVVRRDSPETLGMVRKIAHVLKVEATEKP